MRSGKALVLVWVALAVCPAVAQVVTPDSAPWHVGPVAKLDTTRAADQATSEAGRAKVSARQGRFQPAA